jgi:hypothetical protein
MSDFEKGKKPKEVVPETASGEGEVLSDFTLESFQSRLEKLTLMLNEAFNNISLAISEIRELKQTEPNNEDKMNMLIGKYALAVEEANRVNAKINTHLIMLDGVIERLPEEDSDTKLS